MSIVLVFSFVFVMAIGTNSAESLAIIPYVNPDIYCGRGTVLAGTPVRKVGDCEHVRSIDCEDYVKRLTNRDLHNFVGMLNYCMRTRVTCALQYNKYRSRHPLGTSLRACLRPMIVSETEPAAAPTMSHVQIGDIEHGGWDTTCLLPDFIPVNEAPHRQAHAVEIVPAAVYVDLIADPMELTIDTMANPLGSQLCPLVLD